MELEILAIIQIIMADLVAEAEANWAVLAVEVDIQVEQVQETGPVIQPTGVAEVLITVEPVRPILPVFVPEMEL